MAGVQLSSMRYKLIAFSPHSVLTNIHRRRLNTSTRRALQNGRVPTSAIQQAFADVLQRTALVNHKKIAMIVVLLLSQRS
jgi:hypothetical protein